ncbi:MAG TPA: CBS domain-containing protein, partial [Pirellulales bacterium]|jgi:arabinose-5-phosphate isomerase
MLVGEQAKLAGVFTDSDLARLFETNRDAALDRPIREVMTAKPRTVPLGSMMVDAVAIMAERKISELPVVDAESRPLGLLDITDVVALFPEAGLGHALDEPGPIVARFTPERASAAAPFPPRECA